MRAIQNRPRKCDHKCDHGRNRRGPIVRTPAETHRGVPRLVVLEFPSMEALKRFYHSAEYAPLIALRQQSARSVLVAVEGV